MYAVIDKSEKKGYLIPDAIILSKLIGRSPNTIHNWFRGGVRYCEYGNYNIVKGVIRIKNPNRERDNLKYLRGEK